MASPENPLARIAAELPAHLPRQLPQRVEKLLPGGFRNRLVQWGLGLLISLGLSYVVRRMLERREQKRVAAPKPAPAAIRSQVREQATTAAVAPVMTDAPVRAGDSRAVRYPLLGQPHINLSGTVDQAMYASFREQLAVAPAEGSLVVSLSTLGGDPEVARLMGDEIRLLREYNGREILFLGKVAVYSAGATLMSAFPVDKRFLTRGTRIMVHERIMNSTIELAGPLKSLVGTIKAKLHEIEHSVLIEEEGFRDLVAGSKIGLEEVRERAPANWYIEAEEARDLGLVLDVI